MQKKNDIEYYNPKFVLILDKVQMCKKNKSISFNTLEVQIVSVIIKNFLIQDLNVTTIVKDSLDMHYNSLIHLLSSKFLLWQLILQNEKKKSTI